MPVLTPNETTTQTTTDFNAGFIAPGASGVVSRGAAIDTLTGAHVQSLIHYGTLASDFYVAVAWLADGGCVHDDGIIALGQARSLAMASRT